MSTVRIDQLPEADPLDGSESVPVSQGGQTRRTGGLASIAHVDSVASDVKAQTRYASGAQVPLDIPTYDDDPSVTHPDVVLFDEPWNGWRYWMAFTPYPDDGRENPSIVVSNDGVNWQVPDGLTNPLWNAVDVSGVSYFADTHLVYDAANGLLVLYFIGVDSGASTTTVYRSTTADGITWTDRGATSAAELTAVVVGGGVTISELLSPAVVIEDDGSWTMWTVTHPAGGTGTVEKRTSADAGLTWGAATVCTLPNIQPWHLDVALVGGVYHMLLNGHPTAREGAQLFYLTSTDGETWVGETTQAVPHSGLPFDAHRHYRSAFVPVPDGDSLSWDIWVSGIPDGPPASVGDREWRLGYFRGVRLATDPRFQPRNGDFFDVGATSFIAVSGSPTLDRAGFRFPAWILAADVQTQLNASFEVPPWWETFNYEFLWANSSTATGDVNLAAIHSARVVGDDVSAGDVASADRIVTASGQHILVATSIPTGATVDGVDGAAWHIRALRKGNQANDTLTGSVAFLGVRVTRLT